MKKTAISLVSYDANYLPNSISTYYDYVDEIILGLDKDRITWNNNPFTFDEQALYDSLRILDKHNKISIVEENFHKSKIAIENDNYERNFLKSYASNDWIVSIDADECLLNAKDFFLTFCPIAEKYAKRADICMHWATPYKQIEDTVLVIANEDDSPFLSENQGFMTHKDNTFVYARWSNISAAGDNRLLSPLISIHWSLCRPKDELFTKINNTGHADLVNKDPFFNLWSQVTLDNYHELRNFKTSGLGSTQWPKLLAVPINEINNYYSQAINKVY